MNNLPHLEYKEPPNTTDIGSSRLLAGQNPLVYDNTGRFSYGNSNVIFGNDKFSCDKLALINKSLYGEAYQSYDLSAYTIGDLLGGQSITNVFKYSTSFYDTEFCFSDPIGNYPLNGIDSFKMKYLKIPSEWGQGETSGNYRFYPTSLIYLSSGRADPFGIRLPIAYIEGNMVETTVISWAMPKTSRDASVAITGSSIWSTGGIIDFKTMLQLDSSNITVCDNERNWPNF